MAWYSVARKPMCKAAYTRKIWVCCLPQQTESLKAMYESPREEYRRGALISQRWCRENPQNIVNLFFDVWQNSHKLLLQHFGLHPHPALHSFVSLRSYDMKGSGKLAYSEITSKQLTSIKKITNYKLTFDFCRSSHSIHWFSTLHWSVKFWPSDFLASFWPVKHTCRVFDYQSFSKQGVRIEGELGLPCSSQCDTCL